MNKPSHGLKIHSQINYPQNTTVEHVSVRMKKIFYLPEFPQVPYFSFQRDFLFQLKCVLRPSFWYFSLLLIIITLAPADCLTSLSRKKQWINVAPMSFLQLHSSESSSAVMPAEQRRHAYDCPAQPLRQTARDKTREGWRKGIGLRRLSG